MKQRRLEAMHGYTYILPSLILIVCFSIIPIFMSAFFSFTEYNVMNPPKLVGMDNYEKILQDEYVREALINTLKYVVITVPIQTILALVFAAFIAVKMQNKAGEFLRSVMFIPVIASAVTSGTIWRTILGTDGGIVNNILGVFGIDAINWLGDSRTSLISICIVAIWKNVGYFLVIFYAGIMDVPKSLYEAARVDGANMFQQFFRITLPMLKPITSLVVTLGIIWSFQVFDLSYQMTGGGPGYSSVTIVMAIYNAAFKNYKMGYACALAMVLLVIVLLINALKQHVFGEKEG
ncbi:MAG: sugar ABC transporter permease [Oscillospiraceae bacterium]|nr:sugar ABC transporter permease [Oscillospiraceae bacterium]